MRIRVRAGAYASCAGPAKHRPLFMAHRALAVPSPAEAAVAHAGSVAAPSPAEAAVAHAGSVAVPQPAVAEGCRPSAARPARSGRCCLHQSRPHWTSGRLTFCPADLAAHFRHRRMVADMRHVLHEDRLQPATLEL